jgi:hypothetical protein
MTNKEEYEYALIDSNNVVVSIAVFDTNDDELIQLITAENNAVNAISCNQFGQAAVNGTWNGERFLDSEGNKLPLTKHPKSENKLYHYDYEQDSWQELSDNLRNLFM